MSNKAVLYEKLSSNFIRRMTAKKRKKLFVKDEISFNHFLNKVYQK